MAVPLLLPLHVTEVELALNVKAAGWVTDVVAVAIQPFLSVKVTV